MLICHISGSSSRKSSRIILVPVQVAVAEEVIVVVVLVMIVGNARSRNSNHFRGSRRVRSGVIVLSIN